MITIGGKCDVDDRNYYCYFLLDGNKIICSYDAINDLPENLEKVNSIYLNATMLIELNANNKYMLSVEGPDGGTYFEYETSLTRDNFVQLLQFFKAMTN